MAKKKMTLEEMLEDAIVKDAPYEMPVNWINIKFKYVINDDKNSLKRGPFGSAIKKDFFVPSGYKVYEQKNAIYNDMTLGSYYIDENKYKELEAFSVKPGDLIVSCSGTVGRIAVIPDEAQEGIMNQALLKIQLDNRIILTQYFIFLFNSEPFISKVLDSSRGTAIKNIAATKVLKEIGVPIPPLKEQQRIVDKIESLFEKLDKAKELIEYARDDFGKRKSAILERAFRGELTKEWRNINSKYNAFSELESIKGNNDRKYNMTENSNVKFEIPKSWIWTNLGELTDLLSDYHSNGSYKVLKEKVELLDEPDYACMIRTTNFEKDNFTDLMKYITKDAYEHLSKSKLFGEEILINKIGNAGSVYFMPTLGRPASLAMNLFMLRISDYVSSKYIYYHLKSIYSSSDINQFVRGITTKTIDKKSINSLNIALPPLEEQKELVRILDKLLEDESKIEELTKLEEQIKLIKKSILSKAFRGELGTNCEDDESALELLKEILNKEFKKSLS